MRVTWSLAILCFFTLAHPGAVPTSKSGLLYVENTNGGDITVISIPAFKVVNTIKVGEYPDDVVASHNGSMIYVNRVNALESLPPNLARLHIGESGEIMAVSTVTQEIVWRLPVSGWPHHMALTRDDLYLFVPLWNTAYLDVIDTQKRALVAKVPVGLGGHGTRLSADGKRLYVGTMVTDHIAVIDAQTFKMIRHIPLDDGIRPFDITKDEKRLYVQLSRLHGFVVVDLETDEVINRINLPPLPDTVRMPRDFPHTVNHGLALSPDEKFLFVAASVADYVAVYSLPDLELRATIPTGRVPNWIIFDEDGDYCYVSNRRSNDISVISVRERKEIARIPVGQYPQRMVFVGAPNR